MLQGVACFMGCHGSSSHAGSGVTSRLRLMVFLRRIVMISQLTGNTVNGNICHTASTRSIFSATSRPVMPECNRDLRIGSEFRLESGADNPAQYHEYDEYYQYTPFCKNIVPSVESNLIFQFPQQNACHHKEILKRGHFVMPNQLIFEGDAEECRKDIIFFAPAACMALQGGLYRHGLLPPAVMFLPVHGIPLMRSGSTGRSGE
jgi:hypothetical protein